MLAIKLFFVLTALAIANGDSSSNCGTSKRVGCFMKLGDSASKHVNTLLYNGRADIVWSDYKSSLQKILCKCEQMARDSGKHYVMLGLQYYGECWASESGIADILPMPESKDCLDEIFEKCHSGSTYCAGTDKTTVIYALGSSHHDNNKINGGFNQWSSWTGCSATCGKGTQERVRECNNPKPENGGEDCIGEFEAIQECHIKACESTDITTPRHCKSIERGEEFTTLAAGVDPSFFAPPFCMVPLMASSSGSNDNALNYDVTVDVFCLSDTYSRIGIFFNAKDEENYNFAYVHIKSEFYCYSAGVVKDNKVSWGQRIDDQCQNTVFRTERWIPLKLSVRNGKQVRFYGNNGLVAEWTLDGVTYGASKVGLLVRNSFNEQEQTRMHFNNLKVNVVSQ